MDAALFNINATTGNVTFKASPNFESPGDAGGNNVYDIVVQASDGALTATKAVAIAVSNVNEAPSWTSGATATTPENVSTAAPVYTATGTDPDANTTLSYSISGGADASMFSINAATGVVSFRASPNFEAPADAGANNVYDIAVQASDGSLTATKAVAITVTNVNEAPAITPSTAVASNTKPAISGTAEALTTVTVFDGAATLGTAKASAMGAWTFTPTTALTTGNHIITATSKDAAGNVSPASAAITLTVDTTAPDKPVLTTPSSSTNNATPTITGTAEALSTVTIYDDTAVLGTANARSDGVWTFTPTTALTTAAHIITARATDAAGNTSAASSAITLTVDTAPPSKPVITTLTSSTGSKNPIIFGTAEATSTVSVYDGTACLGTAKASASGVWAFTPATPLTEAPHTITATATDSAGNVSLASSAITLTVDATAPGAPVLTTPSKITSAIKPTIAGTAEANSTVTLDDGALTLGTAKASANGDWTFTPAAALTAAPHTITAKATDAAGNVSGASTAITLTVDATAPDKPVLTTLSGSIKTATPVISGSAEANSTVTVFDGANALGTATASGSGSWTFTPSTGLSSAVHTITAKATDAAGNVSVASAPITLTLDLIAPEKPVLTTASGSTNNAKLPISGTAEASSTITVYDGSNNLWTAKASSAGAWTFTPTMPLSDGTHVITVTATDAAGNISDKSAPVTLSIDATAPDKPTLTALTSPSNNTKPTIAGTAEAGSTVTVYDGATALGTATAGSGGAWSLTPTTALTAAVHSITAKAKDAAGNVSAASTAITVTVDLTAPTKPVLTTLKRVSRPNNFRHSMPS